MIETFSKKCDELLSRVIVGAVAGAMYGPIGPLVFVPAMILAPDRTQTYCSVFPDDGPGEQTQLNDFKTIEP